MGDWLSEVSAQANTPSYVSHGPWTEAERQEAIRKQLEAWLLEQHVFTRHDLARLADCFDEPVRP